MKVWALLHEIPAYTALHASPQKSATFAFVLSFFFLGYLERRKNKVEGHEHTLGRVFCAPVTQLPQRDTARQRVLGCPPKPAPPS